MTNLKVEQVEYAFANFASKHLDLEAVKAASHAVLVFLKLADDHEYVMQNDYWLHLCQNYTINIWRLDSESDNEYCIGIYEVDENGDIHYDDPVWSDAGCI